MLLTKGRGREGMFGRKQENAAGVSEQPGDLFFGILRGNPEKGLRQSPAEARFEAPNVIAGASSLRYEPDKLFLGVIGAGIEMAKDDRGREYRYAQGGAEIGIGDDRHMMTVAGSRAGKGRAAIIPNMLRYAGSVLAIDPKGELARETAERRKQLGQRVLVIDPFGTTEGKLKKLEAGFNPFETMGKPSYDGDKMILSDDVLGKLIEDTALIADALVVTSGRDPHWDESARTLIEGVIIDVATAKRFEGRRNLVTVRNLIARGESVKEENPPDIAGLYTLMSNSPIDIVKRAADDFFQRSANEMASVLSSTRRHLRALNFREIELSLSRESFDLSDLKKQPMTVYLCLPGRHIGTCAVWLRLFVNMALQAMERTQGKPKIPVLFVLDEFATLGHMRQIEDAAGQIAGYGVKLWPILQDLGQLKTLYENRWETFMGNSGVLQFFGNNDLTTLEWISKRLGTTTIEQVSGDKATPDQRNRGQAEEKTSFSTIPMMEMHEIALVFGRADDLLRQLVIVADYAPMILQRAYYDKHRAFR